MPGNAGGTRRASVSSKGKRIPVGACGVPLAPVLASLNSLHWINFPAPISTKLPAGVDPPPVNY